MATTLDLIGRYLAEHHLCFTRDDGNDLLMVPFEHERIGRLVVVVRLEENGEFLKIMCPRLFMYPDGPHKLPLMQTLLLTSWETKMLQWEYDPADGEIRAIVEFPLEDAILTQRQFSRAFTGLTQMVERFYPRLKAVIETGVDPGREGSSTASDDLMRAFQEFLRDRRDGAGDEPGRAGGHDNNDADVPIPDAL